MDYLSLRYTNTLLLPQLFQQFLANHVFVFSLVLIKKVVIIGNPECFKIKNRSIHRMCILRNFAKFTGKHLCHSLFLIKLQPKAQCFPVNFAKFLTTPFLTEHLRWRLLECFYVNCSSLLCSSAGLTLNIHSFRRRCFSNILFNFKII